jgi:phage-related protein (TIGR01555 family)
MSEIERYDSSPLINVAVGVGTRRDPHEQTFVRSPLVYNREALDAYYRSSWACRRVVEIMPRLMCRKWGALTLGGEGNTDAIAYTEKRHGDLKVRANFKKAQTWANLYGRAYILMVVDDNEDYREPLENGAKIENLLVLDRWKLYPEQGITGWDILNPEYYTLASTQTSKLVLPDTYVYGQKIHKSRVLIFSGNDLPDVEKQRNHGCESSVLESFVDVWKRFFVGYASLSRLLVDFDIFVHSIDGLFEKLWQGGREAENTLRSRIETNDLLRSVYRTVVMDKTKESGEFKSRNLGGAGEIADRLKSELVAASGLPQSVLFGEFAAGLDASGKITGEQRYLNDLTEEAQQDKFSDNAHILNDHLLNEPDSPHTPDSFGWVWHPLYTESELGKAEILKIYAETDEINIRSQVYSPVTAQARYLTPQTSGEIVITEGEGQKVEAKAEGRGQRAEGKDNNVVVGSAEKVEEERESIDSNSSLLPSASCLVYDTLRDLPSSRTDAVRLAGLDREGGRVRYKGKLYAPNKPYKVGDRFYVLATKNGFVQLVNFGENDVDVGAIASDPYQPKYWANLYFSFATPEQVKSDASVGEEVSWNYGTGKGYGRVIRVHKKPVTRIIKGSQITRNGTPDNPALEIMQESEGLVLKLSSEVTREDADTLTIAGDVLSEEEFGAIADVDDEDVEEAINNWKQVAPNAYTNILNAQ